MRATFCCVAVFFVFNVSRGNEQTLLLYSVDAATDELVKINPATGHVGVVGSLGIDVVDIDLTNHQGQLYGLRCKHLKTVDLLRINPITGAVSMQVDVTFGGQAVNNHAEGLASLGNELVVSFNRTSSNRSDSESLGTVNPADGSLSGVISYSNADMDGLTADMTGTAEFLSVDVHGPASADNTSLFRVDRSPAQYDAVAAPFLTGHRLHDLAFLGSELYGIEHVNRSLYKFSPKTGEVLQTIPLDREGTYLGLAAIPEPSTLDRVAELERRVARLEQVVESIYSKGLKTETNDLLRKSLDEVAEQLRTKVAEYVTAVSDPSTDIAKIRHLGQEVDRLRKLLLAVVDKEHELQDYRK